MRFYGQYQRPPLGSPPDYIKKATEDVYGDLSKLDSLIFKAACEHVIDQEFPDVESEWLEAQAKTLGLTADHVVDSQEILENKGFVKVRWSIGPRRIHKMSITEWGFNHFARTRQDFIHALHQVAVMIVRDGHNQSLDMVSNSNLKHRYVEHALYVLQSKGYIRTSPLYGSGHANTSVDYWSPELRRDIESNSVIE